MGSRAKPSLVARGDMVPCFAFLMSCVMDLGIIGPTPQGIAEDTTIFSMCEQMVQTLHVKSHPISALYPCQFLSFS